MSLRTFIQHNFWLKLFSVILAMLIWFAIHFAIKNNFRISENSPANSERKDSLRLPVRVLTQPGDDRIFQVEPREVIVSIAGDAAILRDVTPRNISAFIDLSRSRFSRETNQLVKLDLPPGVAIINIDPRTVNVEQILTK